MKIRAIAPWAGSKRRLAPAIVEEIGPHRAWWDLCCGSMAVTLAKPPSTMETCVDMHGDLVNLALILADIGYSEWLQNQARNTWMCNEIYERSARIIKEEDLRLGDPPEPSPTRAFHYLNYVWMSRNGVAGSNGGHNFAKRYTANGGHSATRWRGLVDSIESFNERMRNITILNSDIFEELPRIQDAEGTAIYVDPPYLEKGFKYIHDFDDEGDEEGRTHSRLAKLLQRFQKSRVIVSYYEHPRLAKLYPGWTKRSFEVNKLVANAAGRGSRNARATEVLLINGPSLVVDGPLLGE